VVKCDGVAASGLFFAERRSVLLLPAEPSHPHVLALSPRFVGARPWQNLVPGAEHLGRNPIQPSSKGDSGGVETIRSGLPIAKDGGFQTG
jgi:hypothetical protein